eukprot:symbB.v1.2.008016.t1/scaffold498.1/size458234/8
MSTTFALRKTFIDEEVIGSVARYHSCPVEVSLNVQEMKESVYVSQLEVRAATLGPEHSPSGTVSWGLASFTSSDGSPSSDASVQSTDETRTCPPLVLSYGSYGHPELCHRPCVHLAKGQCAAGADCGYCHCQHSRPVHPDKKQRVFLNSLSYSQLLATVLPFIRRRVYSLPITSAPVRLLELLERETMLRPAEACGIRDRSFNQLLQRMSLAGLVGLLSVRSPPCVLVLLRQYMEDLRVQIKAAEGP